MEYSVCANMKTLRLDKDTVERGLETYQKVHGYLPSHCRLNPKNSALAPLLKGIEVELTKSVLQHEVWLGGYNVEIDTGA